MTRVACVLLVLATVVALLFDASGRAATASATTPLTWLAAGDSYSSGQGLPHATGPCARAVPDSGSNTWADVAYELLQSQGADFSPPDLVACTGATSDDLIVNDDAAGAPEWNSADGTYDLVTFNFGGDNIGFRAILEQCLGLDDLVTAAESDLTVGIVDNAPAPSDPGHTCPAAGPIRQSISALGSSFSGTGGFLASVANQVVTPGGNIVVVGYPELIELPMYWPTWEQLIGDCWGIGTGDATEIRGLAGALNAALGSAVTSFDALPASSRNGVTATFLDVNTGNPDGPTDIPFDDQYLFEPSSGPRHNLCAAQEWINGIKVTTSIRSLLKDLEHSFHPNQDGNDAEGHLVADVISHLDWKHLATTASCTATSIMTAVAGYAAVTPGYAGLYQPEGQPVCRGGWATLQTEEVSSSGQFLGPDQAFAQAQGTAWKVVALEEGDCSVVPAAALAALGLSAGCTTPTTSTTTTTPNTLPVLRIVGGDGTVEFDGTEPAEIHFSTDLTDVVNDITWSSWTTSSATGTGTWNYDDCTPDCDSAPMEPYPATITLSNPQNGVFTTLVETTSGPYGSSITWTYPSYWPMAACETGPC